MRGSHVNRPFEVVGGNSVDHGIVLGDYPPTCLGEPQVPGAIGF